MATEHNLYLRMLKFMQYQQKEALCPQTSREAIDNLAVHRVGVSFRASALETSFHRTLGSLFDRLVPFDSEKWPQADAQLVTGAIFPDGTSSHHGIRRVLEESHLDTPCYFLEQGFLTSAGTWSQAFATGDIRTSCLSYVIDRAAHYYMADYESSLTKRLNTMGPLSPEEATRASAVMDRIRNERISKYNHQPYVKLPATGRRRILVCDQAFADASTVLGRAGEKVFENMLVAAIRENPDAEILVKTHPDTASESVRGRSRPGFFSGLKSYENVRFVTEPMNPIGLLEQVDKVYVATSGMGMEALICRRPVVCFGSPFYAGWGLTDDRASIAYRRATRTLEELFYASYIWYPVYVCPDSFGPCEIEDAIDFIAAHRQTQAADGSSARMTGFRRPNSPKVSVVIPMHNVEAYVEDCLSSVLRQTLTSLEVVVVDDQSQDNSRSIVESMSVSDARIRIITLPSNQGQGMARNAGLEAARGEYVWFLDGDDMLADRATLKALVAMADANDSDVVRGRRRILEEQSTGPSLRGDRSEQYFPHAIDSTTLSQSRELMWNGNCWNFLYRRSFLQDNQIVFALPQWEERAFMIEALLNARKISVADVMATTYRVRPGSTMRRKKTLRDVLMRHQNVRLCLDHLLASGAGDQNSPFNWHLRFCVSRWLKACTSGFEREILRKTRAQSDRSQHLQRLADAICVPGLRGTDLSIECLGEDEETFLYYSLLYESLAARQFSLSEALVQHRRLDQELAYRTLVREASTPLGAALNSYIRVVQPDCKPVRTRSEAGRPRLVLHIGATKTGSTFLQHFCDTNRAKLLEQGVWYPEFGLFWQRERPHKQAGHALFAAAAELDDTRAPLRTALLAGLDALPIRPHTILLSSEAFFLMRKPRKLVAHLHEFFDVEVLVYLRRQDDWANSQYAEFVAGGAVNRISVSIDEWLELPITQERLDYAGLLQRWRDAGKVHKVTVRPYEKAQWIGQDLLSDFCSHLGIDPHDMRLPKPIEGNRMPFSTSHVELIRHFNGLPFASFTGYSRFIDAVGEAVPRSAIPGVVEMLGAEKRMKLVERYAVGNASVAQEYLGDAYGVLFQNESYAAPVSHDVELSGEFVSTVFGLYERFRSVVGSEDLRPGRDAREGQGKSVVRRASVRAKLRKLQRDPSAFVADSRHPLMVLLRGDASVRDTAKVIGSVSGRKLGKLRRDPVAFCRDSSNPLLRGLVARFP